MNTNSNKYLKLSKPLFKAVSQLSVMMKCFHIRVLCGLLKGCEIILGSATSRNTDDYTPHIAKGHISKSTFSKCKTNDQSR